MIKRMIPVGLVMVWMVGTVFGVQPNYVETTTYNVDGANSHVVTTEYSDGLGRKLQTKLKLGSEKDRVTCTFYDNLGRPQYTTKAFLDTECPGKYLSGDLSDDNVRVQLEYSYPKRFEVGGDTRAFAENVYWDVPGGQLKKTIGPGEDFQNFGKRSWSFGVQKNAEEENFMSMFIIQNGFITKFFQNPAYPDLVIDPEYIAGCLDQYENTASYRNYEDNYILRVTLSYRKRPDSSLDDNVAVITQELKDSFGRTVGVLSSPLQEASGTNEVTGIMACSRSTYDPLGNILRQTPPKEHVFDADSTALIEDIEYSYNTAGQLLWKEMPDGCEERYVYRDDGQLETVEAFVVFDDTITVRKLEYIYDKIGRNIEIRDITGENEKSVVYYYYNRLDELDKQDVFAVLTDAHKNMIKNIRGRLLARVAVNYVNAKELKVGEVYSYDDDGQILFKFQVMSGYPMVQENHYNYDVHGKLKLDAFYYSGDHILKRYCYDHLGRLDSVEQGKLGPGNVYSFTTLSRNNYNELGQLANKEFSAVATDLNVEYEYDILGRITDISAFRDGNTLFEENIWNTTDAPWTSGYDIGGNIGNLKYTYAVGSDIVTYTEEYAYDDLNRLHDGKSKYTKNGLVNTTEDYNYEYDILGRFKSKSEGDKTISDYTYYSGTNINGVNVHGTSRLKHTSKNASDGEEYLYDRIGNAAVDFTRNMVTEYDWRDRPIAFRFYNTLADIGLAGDVRGNYMGEDLYGYIDSKVDEGAIQLVSSVIMLYNADGNRVCKMEVKE